MSIFNRLSREQIRADFTHTGLLLGIVPIYIAFEEPQQDSEEMFSSDDVIVCERNGIPEFALPLVAGFIEIMVWLLNFGGLRPAFPTKYPMFITGEIN